MRRGLLELAAVGCSRAYVVGSFTSANREPGDFDVAFEIQGIDYEALDAADATIMRRATPTERAAQRARFDGGEFMLVDTSRGEPDPLLEYLKSDKYTGEPRGIIAIDLGGLQ